MTTQVQVKAEVQQDGVGLAVDFPVLRRRRMMGLANGVTVTTLAGGDTDVLTRSGIVRSDLRRSFGRAVGVARGVPLAVRLRVLRAGSGRPVVGQALYLWSADRDGAYSLHSPGLEHSNYLRGIQSTDATGPGSLSTPSFRVRAMAAGRTSATRSTPSGAWSPGPTVPARAPSRRPAASASRPTWPLASTASRGYEDSAAHLALATPVTDDGGELAMATVTGDLARGLVATRTISI